MIGVKLTVLFIVLTLVVLVVLHFIGASMTAKEAADYHFGGTLPKRLYSVAAIFTLLLVLDSIGIVYSVIYLLFLR